MYKYKRITVKIGSNVLTTKEGMLDTARMSALVSQMAELHKNGVEIILVSSGAVASGRGELQIDRKLDAVKSRQLFSAVGQVKLVNNYYEMFKSHGINCGQILTMKENFSTRRLYLNQKQCMEVMLEHGVIPIVNENDTVAVTELMFTDNDELSGLIATMMDVSALVILSNINGLYTGLPSDPGTRLLATVHPHDDLSPYVRRETSGHGRGGMLTKARIARKVAAEGITVWIANGRRERILPDLMDRPESVPCTCFVPSSAPVSGIKKWIAHSDSFSKGEIWLDAEVSGLLLRGEAVSILPVGITRLEGDFEADDLIRVISADGRCIGLGKAERDAETVASELGHKGRKPVVHYDFLYIE